MEAKKARNKFYHQTARQSYYMKPSDASIIDINAKVPPVLKTTTSPPRLGIVVMTKKPMEFEQWLAYHYRIVGVRKFYVQCEDTPELANLLCYPPWNECVDATFVGGTRRDYFVQMDRQATHVASAVPRARADGVDWLLHIDDDELLYCPQGPEVMWSALSSAPETVCDVHLHNIEALAPDASCSSPFASCTTFVVATSRFTSYTNGKSFGKVSKPGIRAHGPHHFRSDADHNKGSLDLPPPYAVVLHYESCTFERWSRKFNELADRHGDERDIVAKLPFPFYRESLVAMHKLAKAARKSHPSPATAQQRVGRSDDQLARDAFAVWANRKVQTQVDLAAHELVVITHVVNAIAELFQDHVLVGQNRLGSSWHIQDTAADRRGNGFLADETYLAYPPPIAVQAPAPQYTMQRPARYGERQAPMRPRSEDDQESTRHALPQLHGAAAAGAPESSYHPDWRLLY